jgi:hypothetical protein
LEANGIWRVGRLDWILPFGVMDGMEREGDAVVSGTTSLGLS